MPTRRLNAGDDAFARLRLWTDSNGDGVSEAGELKTLSDLGVKSISLAAKTSVPDDKSLADNQILTTSTVTFVDGSTRTLYDIALGIDDPDSDADSGSSSTPSTTPSLPVAPVLPVATDLSLRPLAGTPQTAGLDNPARRWHAARQPRQCQLWSVGPGHDGGKHPCAVACRQLVAQ